MDMLAHRLFMTAAAVVALCACLTLALPAAARSDSVPGDLSELASLIDRLKTLDTGSAPEGPWAVLSAGDEEGTSHTSHSTGPASSSSSSATAGKLAALKRGFLGFNKRQGSWSYDYGLGGGRFGKRYYGDYGIGGGRFGRDVDHVDVADSNDVTL